MAERGGCRRVKLARKFGTGTLGSLTCWTMTTSSFAVPGSTTRTEPHVMLAGAVAGVPWMDQFTRHVTGGVGELGAAVWIWAVPLKRLPRGSRTRLGGPPAGVIAMARCVWSPVATRIPG